MKGKDTRAYPYQGYPPITRLDHKHVNSVPYSFRTVRGFFYVPQDYEELRDGAYGFIVLVRED